MVSRTDWSGWGGTVAQGAVRVAVMASVTKPPVTIGEWQPARTFG